MAYGQRQGKFSQFLFVATARDDEPQVACVRSGGFEFVEALDTIPIASDAFDKRPCPTQTTRIVANTFHFQDGRIRYG